VNLHLETPLIALSMLAFATAGCATNPRPAGTLAGSASEWSVPLAIHGRPLDLHLMAPRRTPAAETLVLYASGDGGWFGAAVDMFHRIGEAGYYTVGISSRSFMKIDRPPHNALNPEQVAAEFGEITAAARSALHLPSSTPVVLTGWSRGAALSVLAASARHMSNVRGVIAIGLAEGERLAIDGPDDESDEAVAESGEHRWPYDPYTILARLSVPCAVIQATKDPYLSATRARTLFGADTTSRHFYEVEARNHRFSGGKAAFDRTLIGALEWIVAAGRSTSDANPATAQEATWRH
jgi:pimeloyl-ACP methyl ester carboxylesterase